ncbi:cupredoxin domain-containing protein [Microbacterium sp. gxy059]|uniref:cupredoxin domain-containing protein n=1 Tax=Microbacterium sp. gxy059 TaxID=2957199 RepID=UPI003D990179
MTLTRRALRLPALALLVAGSLAATGCGAEDDAPVLTVEVEADGMRYAPDRIEVPTGTRLVVEFENADDQAHDLVFDDVRSQRLAPGDSETIDVGVIDGDLDGWCSISDHRQMGMTLEVVVVDR